MAGAKIVQFSVIISLMIFSTCALHVLLTDGLFRGFHYKTEIVYTIGQDTNRYYNHCTVDEWFVAESGVTKIIVYIKALRMMTGSALRLKHKTNRNNTAATLLANNIRLLYLGVGDYYRGDERVIAEFVLLKIRFNLTISLSGIAIIPEGTMKLAYETSIGRLNEYQEEEHIFGNDLRGHLNAMDRH